MITEKFEGYPAILAGLHTATYQVEQPSRPASATWSPSQLCPKLGVNFSLNANLSWQPQKRKAPTNAGAQRRPRIPSPCPRLYTSPPGLAVMMPYPDNNPDILSRFEYAKREQKRVPTCCIAVVARTRSTKSTTHQTGPSGWTISRTLCPTWRVEKKGVHLVVARKSTD